MSWCLPGRMCQSQRFATLLKIAMKPLALATVVWLAQGPLPAVAQQLSTDEQAQQTLGAGQRAFNERQYPFAVDRFREFLQKFGGHRRAADAKYGLALALLEAPQPDLPPIIDLLRQIEGQADFAERPWAMYHLGRCYRRLGLKELEQATSKPAEAPQRLAAARQQFEHAAPRFATAANEWAARLKVPARVMTEVERDWLARMRCDHAEMLLHLGKHAEARDAVAPVTSVAMNEAGPYAALAHYDAGQACFALRDWGAAVRHLARLAPFQDPDFGPHAQYLLARIHHESGERPEALALYDALLKASEERQSKAQQRLQSSEVRDQPEERARLERVAHAPPPVYIVQALFYRGVLLYELERFEEALLAFQSVKQRWPDAPLVKEAELRKGMCQVQVRQFPAAVKTLQPLLEQPDWGDVAFRWTGRALLRSADPKQPLPAQDVVRQSLDAYRQAVDRARRLPGNEPAVRTRRNETLLEYGDALIAAQKPAEAADIYQHVVQDRQTPWDEQALERQTEAWQLAGKTKESSEACQRFAQTFGSSLLLAPVEFRRAENAFLAAMSARQQAQPEADTRRLFDETVQRYEPLLKKYPEFEQLATARRNLAASYHALGRYDVALATLSALPESDRVGPLANASYLQADCLWRLLPAADAEDALSAARLLEQLERAISLLSQFVVDESAPEAPDALLKLGVCHMRLGHALAEPDERRRALELARQRFDRLLHQFPKHPRYADAVCERARCLAALGDMHGAMHELARFESDPLKQSPVAPLALLRLAGWQRDRSQFPEALKTLEVARGFESALGGDPRRKGWIPLLQYQQALTLREAGKLVEARAAFETIARQFPKSEEGQQATWRGGQCRREESLRLLQVAREALARGADNAPELAAFRQVRDASTRELQETLKSLQEQARQLAGIQAGGEPQLQALYQAAWCARHLADLELESARQRIARDRWKARANEPSPPEPDTRVLAAAAELVPLTDVPIGEQEKKSRELYQALNAAAGAHPLGQEGRLELAELLARRAEHAPAVDLLKGALEAEPSEDLADRLRLRLGTCLQAQGQWAEAAAQFRAVARQEVTPRAALARSRAGECLNRTQAWDEAVRWLLPFRDQGPFQNIRQVTDRALLHLAAAYAGGLHWTECRQTCETLIGRFSQSECVDEARYAIGWALQNQQQFDQAIEQYRQVIARTSSEVAARAQFQIGVCQSAQHRPAEAANAWLAVPFTYEESQWNALALCEAARAFVELKQTEQATRLLERVLRDYRDTPAAAAARKRLDELSMRSE